MAEEDDDDDDDDDEDDDDDDGDDDEEDDVEAAALDCVVPTTTVAVVPLPAGSARFRIRRLWLTLPWKSAIFACDTMTRERTSVM